MSDPCTIDARGLSCPQPVVLAKNALTERGQGEVFVLVDSDTARENVSRIATKMGWAVRIEEQPDESCRMCLTK